MFFLIRKGYLFVQINVIKLYVVGLPTSRQYSLVEGAEAGTPGVTTRPIALFRLAVTAARSITVKSPITGNAQET